MVETRGDMYDRYCKFKEELPIFCNSLQTSPEELTFKDYRYFIGKWIKIITGNVSPLLR